MKYQSTRGGSFGLTFEDVLFSGYAPDGGLMFPESIPSLSKETLEKWKTLDYVELVKEISALFISQDEIPRSDLNDRIEKAFKKFPAPVIPIKRLDGGLNVAELFHGPTMTFKDLALSVVGQLYDYFLERNQERKIVLVGTSGDTGSAAINAIKDLEFVDIVVLLPKGRCTEIQERQMTTVISDNVHNFAVEGTSDDLDMPIKIVFGDSDFAKKFQLCSINSINWVRVMVQMAHFAYCYFQSEADEVELAVPTGACGNITGGYILRAMGVPIKLVAAVAENDIVHRTLNHSDFSVHEEVFSTWASAIDIQIPYNMERMLFVASNGNSKVVKELMEKFEKNQGVEIPNEILSNVKSVIFDSHVVSNEEIVETIKETHEKFGYAICPHTAVAVNYHLKKGQSKIPRICIATASPAKFPEVFDRAGIKSNCRNEEIEALLKLPTKFEWMRSGQDWTNMLREKIRTISKERQEKE